MTQTAPNSINITHKHVTNHISLCGCVRWKLVRSHYSSVIINFESQRSGAAPKKQIARLSKSFSMMTHEKINGKWTMTTATETQAETTLLEKRWALTRVLYSKQYYFTVYAALLSLLVNGKRRRTHCRYKYLFIRGKSWHPIYSYGKWEINVFLLAVQLMATTTSPKNFANHFASENGLSHWKRTTDGVEVAPRALSKFMCI